MTVGLTLESADDCRAYPGVRCRLSGLPWSPLLTVGLTLESAADCRAYPGVR